MVNMDERILFCFLVGKARVTTKKFVSMPRLELVAAILSVKVAHFLKKELKIDCFHETYWSDSKVVLGYKRNNTKKFTIFVANRIQQIQEYSEVKQWRYVPTKINPADYASRGLSAPSLHGKSSRWFTGSEFLWTPEDRWEIEEHYESVNDADPEVKSSVKVNTTAVDSNNIVIGALERISSWKKMRHVVAIMLKWKEILHNHERQKISNRNIWYLDMCSMQTAEVAIIRLCQGRYFEKDINALRNGKSISKQRNIYKLDPFLEKKGILRVGGRIRKSILEYKLKHPVLLPREGHIASVIMTYYHEKVAHAGRGITINELISQGYWIINCTSAVKSMISRCVDCRRFRGNVCQQKMGDLPLDRLTQEPPFTYWGIEMFGPFLIKDGRKQRKYYGAMLKLQTASVLIASYWH